jgi:hypothetical protein
LLRTFDWMTATVETAGLVIFLIWIIQPIREFAGIFRSIRKRRPAATVKQSSNDRERIAVLPAAPPAHRPAHRELAQTRA